MKKFSFEFKKKMVMKYLSGEEGGFESLSKKYSVSYGALKRWVHGYEKMGDAALIPANGRKTYSFEFKLSMVESYLTTDISFKDLAFQNKMNTPGVISHWVRQYKKGGPDALKNEKKEISKTLEQSKKNSASEKDEYIKQLEKELTNLKIENAYLKELRSLRIQEETLVKKQQGSFTNSEDNSN